MWKLLPRDRYILDLVDGLSEITRKHFRPEVKISKPTCKICGFEQYECMFWGKQRGTTHNFKPEPPEVKMEGQEVKKYAVRVLKWENPKKDPPELIYEQTVESLNLQAVIAAVNAPDEFVAAMITPKLENHK